MKYLCCPHVRHVPLLCATSSECLSVQAICNMLREFCSIRSPTDAHKLDFECWGCPACALGLLYWSESCHFADLHKPSVLPAHAGKTLQISACDFALFYVPSCSCASLTHPQRSLSAIFLLIAECPVIWPNLMSLSEVPSEKAVCPGSLQHFPHSYFFLSHSGYRFL